MKEYCGENIIIMTCSKCNNVCKHCYISYKGDISVSNLSKMVNLLKQKYSIMLNGTEPLLNLKYLSIYKDINQNYLLTNGLSLINDYNIVNNLKENNINMISISYHFGIHNELSLINNKKIIELVKKLLESNFKVRLLCTITTKNYNIIEEFCDFAYALGVQSIKFTNYIYQGSAKNLSNNNILTQKQINTFFKLLTYCRKKYSKEELLIQRCGSFGPDNFNKNNKFNCPAEINNVVITPDMNVYRCIFLIQKGLEIGKYYNGKIFIENNLNSNCNLCLAKEICNNGGKI